MNWEHKIADGALVYHYPIIEFLPNDNSIDDIIAGKYTYTFDTFDDLPEHMIEFDVEGIAKLLKDIVNLPPGSKPMPPIKETQDDA
jgi:hypothetical protein